ncbi:hypothetical protein [Aureispira sp. CCB-E]|uniref:hypothetical protein n=1 Tax=Aureispira sp. CCB-E TaxID=3051121 RepID=UPI00286852BA|nr:hypothetical protein [Aureispira sp. CCB-E]WMX15112.1 hypothetical protein QP953_01855 [Aureispira sp. CCB-E]
MRTTILTICFCSILLSCQNDNQVVTAPKTEIPPQRTIPLNISLNMTQPSYQLGDPITLRFVIKNNTSEIVSFCKLNSPANGQNWNNCFQIKDKKGNIIPFVGKIPTYSGAVEDSDLISIEGNGVQLYTIDLRPRYALDQPGTYSIRFIGDQVNLLSNSLPARFTIK